MHIRDWPRKLRRFGALSLADKWLFLRAVTWLAIARAWLLQAYGYTSAIHLGVEKAGDDTLAGHAWLTCGTAVVTGGEGLDRFVEIHRLGE